MNRGIFLAATLLLVAPKEARADTRHIIFENLTRETAHDLHVEFESLVHVDLPGAISVPANGGSETVPFENDDIDQGGTNHNFYGGSVPGDPEGKNPGRIKVRFRSDGDTDIRIKNWYWTRADGTEIPPPAGLRRAADNGRREVFAALGGPARGTGRIQVSIAGTTRAFATIAGASPDETIAAFRVFLSGFIREDTSLIYVPEKTYGRRLVLEGNAMGDLSRELLVEVLSSDPGQLLHFSDNFRFLAVDENQDFRIDSAELTDSTAKFFANNEIIRGADLTIAGLIWSKGDGGYLTVQGDNPLQFLPEGDVAKTLTVSNKTTQPASDLHIVFTWSAGLEITKVEADGCSEPSVTIVANEAHILWDSNCVQPGATVRIRYRGMWQPEPVSGFWTRFNEEVPPRRVRYADIDRADLVVE